MNDFFIIYLSKYILTFSKLLEVRLRLLLLAYNIFKLIIKTNNIYIKLFNQKNLLKYTKPFQILLNHCYHYC
jgi:hypothetical protein